MSGSEGYYNPYENEIGDIWWSESQTSHQKLSFRVRKLLHEEKTPYQHLLMLDTYQAGKLLALDNRVQLTEIDEFFYHESIVHPGLFSLNRDGLRVLIIGGGDGGVAREVLKHSNVAHLDMVEIDEAVTRICQKHFPVIWEKPDGTNLADDKRLHLYFSDGIAFVGEARGKGEHYDFIIVDSTDPIGPATGLFGKPFYEDLAALSGDNGILVTQAGSLYLRMGKAGEGLNALKTVYRHVSLYWGVVPTYPGGFWSYIYSTNSSDNSKKHLDLKGLREKYNNLQSKGVNFRFYCPEYHFASFTKLNFFESADKKS